jgi:transposase
MEKEGARYQTLTQLHERRKQVVRMHLKGAKMMAIVAMSGLCYQAVRDALDRFGQGGWRAIHPAGRDRESGQGRLLSEDQERLIQHAIIDQLPEQLKLDFYLWSRSAVAHLIEQECGLMLSERTVGKYLKRWGFTPQKPIKKAYEQRPEAVQAWLNEHYPAIAAQVKAEGGEIHCTQRA